MLRVRGFDDVLDPLGPRELAALFPYPVRIFNRGLTLIAVGALAVMGVLDSLRLRILIRISMRIGDTLAARTLRAMVATNSQAGAMAARSGLRDIDTIRKEFDLGNEAGALARLVGRVERTRRTYSAIPRATSLTGNTANGSLPRIRHHVQL